MWPWLILFTPRQHLKKVVVGCIGLSVLACLSGTNLFIDAMWYRLPLFRADALGLGALLAIIARGDRPKFASLALKVGLVAFLWSKLFDYANIYSLDFLYPTIRTLGALGVGLVFVWVVERASVGALGGRFQNLFLHPALLGLGKMSYGFYVIHMFALDMIVWALPSVFRYEQTADPVQLLTMLSVTTGLSWLSRKYLEQPIQTWYRNKHRGAL